MTIKHPAISLSIIVGLVAAAAALYFGLTQANFIQTIIAALAVVFMSYALVDIQRICE